MMESFPLPGRAVERHAFEPVTWQGPTGPTVTDWCGHMPDLTDVETFCGQLAEHAVHEPEEAGV